MSDESDTEVVAQTAATTNKKKKKKKKPAAAEGGTEDAATTAESTVADSTAAPTGADSKETAKAGGDDEDDDKEDGAATGGAKKKKKNKKKGGASGVGSGMPEMENKVLRCLGTWKKTEKQTWPPTIEVAKLYADSEYPEGEIMPYTGEQGYRTTSAEKKEVEKLMEEDYRNIRRAAEVHRQVRRYVQSYVRPGISMVELCQRLESKSLELVGKDGLNAGWGFPTGCSLNHVAAHYTPNYGDKTVMCYNDVCKLDFGIQVGGRIVDSAFTMAFNPKYDPAIVCTQDATNTGLKVAGIDARFSEIGASIQEVIESYEVELDGKTYKMKPVKNLNGHSMGPYHIHAGKSVPIVKNNDTTRMEEGEFYAIETFASTGKGYVIEDYECSHYMKQFDAPKVPLRVKSAKTLLHGIDQHFSTLAFSRRWLDDVGHPRHLMALKNLVDNDLVQPYPPLVDVKGSIVTQMEHTILIKPTCKEIVSRGDDY